MIDDYLTRRINSEDATKRLVRTRPSGDDLSAINSSRAKFLGDLGSRIGGITGASPTFSQEAPKLQRNIEGLAAKNKYTNSRTQFDQAFQLALQQALEAGMDQRSAVEYARQTADQNSAMDFQAGENQKNRDFRWKMNSMQNEYSDKNNALNQDGNDSDAALMRVLLGVGTSVGTSYFLNKQLSSKTKSSIPQGSYASQMNQSFQDQDNQDYMKKYASDYGARGYGGKF